MTALERLNSGNAEHRGAGQVPAHQPFAALLSCADARVPAEDIFDCDAGELFVVRVAGNVLGGEALGSLRYAAGQLSSVEEFVVLGHLTCGAVGTAVDALTMPDTYDEVMVEVALKEIVDALLVPVRRALGAMYREGEVSLPLTEEQRATLVAISAVANAAMTANVLRRVLDRPVACGVYDLASGQVGMPGPNGLEAGLIEVGEGGLDVDQLLNWGMAAR